MGNEKWERRYNEKGEMRNEKWEMEKKRRTSERNHPYVSFVGMLS